MKTIRTSGGVLQDLEYEYDNVGNIDWREDRSGLRYVREVFSYDVMQRLTDTAISVDGQVAHSAAVSYDPSGDLSGNIGSKTGVGNYAYGGRASLCTEFGEVEAGPHAVTQAGALQLCYDAHGNMVRDSSGRRIDYTACANGQPLKCLVVTDEWTHEALEIDVQGSIRSRRVIDVLSKLVSEHGAPRYLRSDNGPEFVSHAILRWLQEAGIETAYIEPGKPWQNGTAESLNGKFRDECLSMECFRNRTEARVIIETWRRHYNEDRPRYLTPKQFKDEQQQRDQASTHRASLN